jgi:tetratricopeptide (TPR) repeat protein
MRILTLAAFLCLAVAAAAADDPVPTDGAGWFRLGNQRLQEKKDAEALSAFQKAFELGGMRGFAGYNVASLHARAGRIDEAFAWLDKVHALGIRPEMLTADADLKPLQGDPRWPLLLKKVDDALHPCRAARHHEFDFWVGSWDVKNAAGQAVGTSQVDSILDGCVVLENWTGRFGDTGKSFNLYDASRKRWQQTWVSDRGVLTEFHGALQDGAMAYTTTSPMPDGTPRHRRLTFTPLSDGRVRQHSEKSEDQGATWTTEYDFFYTRRALPGAAGGAQ